MKLLIFGSTGETGKILIKQALEKNYIVTAFARNPDKVEIKHENLRIIKGDILKYSSLIPAVQGQDVVISALGIRIVRKNTIISEGIKNIIRAMEENKVKRFICMSSVGVGESRVQQKRLGFLFNRVVVPIFLQNMFDDKEIQEKHIMKSSLNWTIVRPVILTNGKKTGNCKSFEPNDTSIRSKVSREDVVDFILNHINNQKHIKEAVSISY